MIKKRDRTGLPTKEQSQSGKGAQPSLVSGIQTFSAIPFR